MRKTAVTFCVLASVLFGSMLMLSSADARSLTNKERLGQFLFLDKTLSDPDGMSCGSCHDPAAGFADPDKSLPVSNGVIPDRVGNRNAPTNAYQAGAPSLATDPILGGFIGGEFRDGRAIDLVEQAKGPFLNPLEMNNPNKSYVTRDVQKAPYVGLFLQVYGCDIFRNVDKAYNAIADAIAAFEKSPVLNRFDSKFDRFQAGKVSLTAQELRGLKLFSDFDFAAGKPGRANCNTCHSMFAEPGFTAPPFTDRKYFNVGVPKNPNNPFYFLPKDLNPLGRTFIDEGLGGFLKSIGQPESVYSFQMGATHVPTLRNVARSGPYMHNGVFTQLATVVHFYNTRDKQGEGWGPPEVGQNVFGFGLIGNQGLSDDEEDDIVAFLKTLTDID